MSKQTELVGLARTTNLDEVNAAYSAGALSNRNKVINGSFDVWQRSVSDANSGYFHVADRWRSYGYSGASSTFSQQAFALGQTDVPQNPKYFARVVSTSNSAYLEHRVENLSQFSGQTITLSFWAKSPDLTSALQVGFYLSYGSGGSTPDGISNASVGNMSSSWAKFTVTTTLPSLSGKTIAGGNDYFEFHVSTTPNTGTLDLAQVQLEVGDTATPFEHRSYGDELQRCQRYYQTNNDSTGQPWFRSGTVGSSTSGNRESVPLHTTMRSAPTASLISGSLINVASGSPSVGLTTNTSLAINCVVNTSNSHFRYGIYWTADAEL